MVKVVGLFAIAMLASPTSAQLFDCLEKVKPATSKTSIWVAIKQYFATLTQDKPTADRARYTSLRSRIVELEAQKLFLITLVEQHLAQKQGGKVSQQISLKMVPDIMEKIQDITDRLNKEAETGGIFADQPAFKQLKIQLDYKRAITICGIEQNLGPLDPDSRKRLEAFLKDLKDELAAISSAEEQLAKFNSVKCTCPEPTRPL